MKNCKSTKNYLLSYQKNIYILFVKVMKHFIRLIRFMSIFKI